MRHRSPNTLQLKTRRNDKLAKNDTLESNRMEWNEKHLPHSSPPHSGSVCVCVCVRACGRRECTLQVNKLCARASPIACAPALVCRLCRLQQPVSLAPMVITLPFTRTHIMPANPIRHCNSLVASKANLLIHSFPLSVLAQSLRRQSTC